MSLLSGIRTLADLPLEGRRVLVRADLDVALTSDGEIADETAIAAALPTMRAALERGAKLVVAAHLAPARRSSAPPPSLEAIGSCLSGLLAHEVHLPDDCVGDAAKKVVQDLRSGQICLLENLHLHREEELGDDAAFAERLAELADVYVGDAPRAIAAPHASVHALARVMRERGAGLALEAELGALDRFLHEIERPYVAVLGGADVEEALALAAALLEKVDALHVGGAVANTFLAARGIDPRASEIERHKLAEVRTLLEKAAERGARIVLPEDVVLSEGAAVDVSAIPDGARIDDLGPRTAARLAAAVAAARTVLVRGPLAARKEHAAGSGQVAQALASAAAFKMAFGDETAAALRRVAPAEGAGALHVSSGGRASLALLEGKKLVALEALRTRGPAPKIVARSAETGDNPARRRS